MARGTLGRASAVVLGAIAVACTFPSVTLAPEGGGGDAGDGGDAAIEATATDANLDAQGDASDPCDQDHDGYRAKGACGGLDCDDSDPRANPGVTQFQTYQPTANTQGDWNCDGKVDKQYVANVTCSVAQIGAACDGTVGFTTDPACGSTGAVVHCKTQNLLCAVDTTMMTLQGCK